MEDNLLFVSRDPVVTQEFLDAMKNYEFHIDTADSGQKAAKMLQEIKYKVVITGMNLSSLDGNKLIAWLNENCPQTVCIVYTTRVDLAELRLLINERNVFRIFLKPVNYHGDFYNSIKDGFSYYDVRAAEKEQQDTLEKQRENAVKTISEMEEAAQESEEERKKLKHFLFPLVKLSLKEFGPQLGSNQVKNLLKQEESILDFYLGKNYKPCQDIMQIQEMIQQEFITGNAKQKVIVKVKKCPDNVESGFVETLYFMIWIVMYQITAISKHYAVKVEISFASPVRTAIQIRGRVPMGAVQQFQKQPDAAFFLELVHTIVDNMTDKYNWKLEEEQLCWDMELKMENPQRKKGLSLEPGAEKKI